MVLRYARNRHTDRHTDRQTNMLIAILCKNSQAHALLVVTKSETPKVNEYQFEIHKF